jgi:hypothetical protein
LYNGRYEGPPKKPAPVSLFFTRVIGVKKDAAGGLAFKRRGAIAGFYFPGMKVKTTPFSLRARTILKNKRKYFS